jgi:transcriptional antiterminator Rof (Rho-off)
MSDDAYVPIACAFHEALEFAVLRRSPLRLIYRDATGEHAIRVMPTDVATCAGAEWLSYRELSGSIEQKLRLDKIVLAEMIESTERAG